MEWKSHYIRTHRSSSVMQFMSVELAIANGFLIISDSVIELLIAALKNSRSVLCRD